ncbi:MAG TPA: hypothetical protein VFC07_13075 [Verrucomicrobiae bacterium]|nr:hypothetical protein [Verrucomicrobiae bacterium]
MKVTFDENTPLEQYIKSVAWMIDKTGNKKLPGRLFTSIEGLLTEQGRAFPFAPFPAELKHFFGKMGRCYENATRLALSGMELIYCEGYALNQGLPIPLMHGFCITPEGAVVDPTWKDGTEYFGVAISKTFLFQTMNQREMYGVLDDWENNYPVLSLEPERWLHPKFTTNRKPVYETT